MLIRSSIQSYMCIGFPDSKYNEPLQVAAELQSAVREILETHIVLSNSSAIIKFYLKSRPERIYNSHYNNGLPAMFIS